MPELKNTFTGGKMEKDLDERIVPSGQYREALNISVSTSEDSDVGAAQNILGNIKVTEAISGPEKKYNGCVIGSGLNRYYGTNKHITHVIDPQNDKLYRFIATTPGEGVENHGVWMDRIVEYDTNAKIETVWQEKEKAVMVDVYKVATKVTSLDVTSEPPPPPITKYGCYEGNCVDIGPSGINNPNITPTYNNDPSCGGSCTEAPTSEVAYCTDKPSLVFPNGGIAGFTTPGNVGYHSALAISTITGLNEPGYQDGSYNYMPIRTISQNPLYHTSDLRTYRYPLWQEPTPMPTSGAGSGYNGYGYHWIQNTSIDIHVALDAKDINGNLITWATPAWQSNVSSLLYTPVFGVFPAQYNYVRFWCIQDFLTWANTIPDFQGNPFGIFTNDYLTGYGTGITGTSFSLQMVFHKKMGATIASGGGGYTSSNTQSSINLGSHGTGAVGGGAATDMCPLGPS